MTSGWPTAKLGELCEIQRGGSPRPIDHFITDSPGGINWIKIGDVGEGEKYIRSTKQRIRPEGAQRSRYVESGDFLLTNSMSFGRPYILRTSGCIHDGWLVLRYDKERLSEDYLYHVLSSDTVYGQFARMASGAVVKNLNSEVVKEVSILLPPLLEQRRIAAILDKADALRTMRREALVQLDRLARAIFVEMFGDPMSNPKGWPQRTLKELGKVATGGTPPSAQDGMFGGDIPFITPGDLEGSSRIRRWVTEAGAREAGVVRAGAALVCCIGATIGKMGMAPGRSAFNQQLNAVEWHPDLVDDHFGLACLRFFRPSIAALGASTTLPILKKSSFEKLSIPVPPRALQGAFASGIEHIERLQTKQREALGAINALFASLQHRAFQGAL